MCYRSRVNVAVLNQRRFIFITTSSTFSNPVTTCVMTIYIFQEYNPFLSNLLKWSIRKAMDSHIYFITQDRQLMHDWWKNDCHRNLCNCWNKKTHYESKEWLEKCKECSPCCKTAPSSVMKQSLVWAWFDTMVVFLPKIPFREEGE